MNFRSHSKNEIELALAHGKPCFRLDTGNSGDDDILIGDVAKGMEQLFGGSPTAAIDEVRSEILEFHDLAEWPKGWNPTSFMRTYFDYDCDI